MKRLLLSLIAVLTLPLAVNADGIDPEVHKLWLPAKDYAVCIKIQTKNKKQLDITKNSTVETMEN